MPTALIYGGSGSGKTVNTTRVLAPKRKRNLLICTDNSSAVLTNFNRPNLSIINVATVEEFHKEYEAACASGKYDTIILDNLSDLIDMWLLELDASGKYKDFRQAYQLMYNSLKRLTRMAANKDCNTVFTAWADYVEMTAEDGTRYYRTQPKIPAKILDNICGLMNVVGLVVKGKDDWGYLLEGKPERMAKDQLFIRKSCKPEDLFTKPVEAKK